MLKTLLLVIIVLCMQTAADAQSVQLLSGHELAANFPTSGNNRGYGPGYSYSYNSNNSDDYGALHDRYKRYLNTPYSPVNTTATVCFVAGIPTFLVGSFMVLSASGTGGNRRQVIAGGALMTVGAGLIITGGVLKWREHGDERIIEFFR